MSVEPSRRPSMPESPEPASPAAWLVLAAATAAGVAAGALTGDPETGAKVLVAVLAAVRPLRQRSPDGGASGH